MRHRKLIWLAVILLAGSCAPAQPPTPGITPVELAQPTFAGPRHAEMSIEDEIVDMELNRNCFRAMSRPTLHPAVPR